MDLFAGRNLDLGASNGVTTVGATENPALPGKSGATINAFAGLTGQPAYQAFVTKYFVDQNTYASQLNAFVTSLTGTSGLNPHGPP